MDEFPYPNGNQPIPPVLENTVETPMDEAEEARKA